MGAQRNTIGSSELYVAEVGAFGRCSNAIVAIAVNPSIDSSVVDPSTELRLAAMDYLARREHSAQELCDKLSGRCDDSLIVRQVVERLSEQGLQSDERFVESFVRSRIQQGKGPLRITQELRHKGISGLLVESGLDGFGANWNQLAQEVRAKRFGICLPEDLKDKARQLRFLQYRGFTTDQAYASLESS